MYRLTCPKTAHYLSAQMALVSTFFQIFIVLGMYNFEKMGKVAQCNTACFWQFVKWVGLIGSTYYCQNMPNKKRTFFIFIGLVYSNAIPINSFKTKSIQEKTKGPIEKSMYNDHSTLEITDPTHQSVKYSVRLFMDFLIDEQISSFCPGQHGGKLLTLIMLHKLTQSL